ncbi:MAG: hypothetical protein GFH27_549303n260 [Chloroflexi bacterium AL-W]|nr:hypothetical protein [Chloroflexi bacterium AL-N1]NOK68145.1 hypothetical protein [Chloroflexi bacterium AL-N10]NOK73485.1 hypothetical protein [Chloroflexi bacterium AL-N5]NOK83399.1 hypothetical protein [Chloroflexi bacterium AL-W]NOK87816.1 hypothetical protein [Chloroflexi bacterium AL-N15]
MEYTGVATLDWYSANTHRAQRGLFHVPQQDVLLISLSDTKYTAWINIYRLAPPVMNDVMLL